MSPKKKNQILKANDRYIKWRSQFGFFVIEFGTKKIKA